ncbi:MAG: DUF4255 domain-containing protein [Bacteroidia bacterium]|jgi:hypothetical protein|nr:DUF4255 domain-containing protein [Bacteroidia bacterium]
MLHEVLPVIVDELRDFLQSRLGAGEDQVVLANLLTPDGTIAITGENKLVVSLVNIERDGTNMAGGAGVSFTRSNPPVHINAYILFAAYFESRNYLEALKFTSGVIGFFQGKSSFDAFNTPMLPHHAGRLRMEIVNVNWHEMSNLWAAIGAKYLPSILYRLRTLDMHEDLISDQIPPIMITEE